MRCRCGSWADALKVERHTHDRPEEMLFVCVGASTTDEEDALIDPREEAADALKWANAEADELMEEFETKSPSALADELMQKRYAFEGGMPFAAEVADVLRERQAEWLKGRRWPERREVIDGRAELMRTSEHEQTAPDEFS